MKVIDLRKKDIEFTAGNCKYKIAGFTYFTYLHTGSNCKHCFIDYVVYFIQFLKQDDNNINIIDKMFLKNSKVTFGMNTSNYENILELNKYFTLISLVEIPTGYYNSYQYHAIYFTNLDCRDSKTYKKKFEKEKEDKNNLPNIVLDKIMSYKSKYYLRKYLKKLIS